ncbi:MAG: hypothetical protein VKO64_05940 [Candidatus Sericytochromatia bacterium]|nr:hypothetical protein [Candidatus Sericytochromatia bacterium]
MSGGWTRCVPVLPLLLGVGCGPSLTIQGRTVPPTPAPTPVASFPWTVSWLQRDKTPATRLAAHDRALYLAVSGASGESRMPDLMVMPPEGVTPPIQEPPVWEQSRGLWTIRLRFLEPSTGYRVVERGAPDGTDVAVPPVEPSLAALEGVTLVMGAAPAVTGPGVPVTLRFRLSATSQTARDYHIRVINPCGWGPEATRSVATLPATISMVIPSEEVIDVTGNYTIRVADVTGGKTYAQAAKATFTYLTR